MNKILIPTDGSELADFAYDIAKQISAGTGADIHALSIIPAPGNVFFDREGNIKEDEGEDISELKQLAAKRLSELEEWKQDKPDVKVVTVHIGRIEEDILSYIRKNNIDLVVMGTKGATGLNEFLRSTHTAHVVKEASIPVLSLKCDRSNYKINDILFISDFHETERIDLSVVKTLQKVFQATLHLLKINTPGNFEPHRAVIENMRKFETMNGLANTQHHVYCDYSMEEGISHFSADTGMDFIVLETHKGKGLARLFRQDISLELVNHLWQPILNIKV